MKDVYNPIDKI